MQLLCKLLFWCGIAVHGRTINCSRRRFLVSPLSLGCPPAAHPALPADPAPPAAAPHFLLAQGRCVVCGGIGVSDAYYCKECTICEKDVSRAAALFADCC